jgi:murein DD-endopeptidase MepM/ murein hydrolase activator NlpD
MAEKKERKKRISKKLLHKYRLVILNEETFEERFALKLTRLNVFVVIGFSTIILIALTTLLIAFTPLREYIPGYSSSKLKKKATHLVYKTDSLQRVVEQKNRYFNSIKQMLTGEAATQDMDSITAVNKNTSPPDNNRDIDVQPSEAENKLRKQVEQEEKYTVSKQAKKEYGIDFFSPVSGQVTGSFDASENHFAVDVATRKDAPVKSIAEGVVIFAEWTAETGNVIIVELQMSFISVYKHNSSLTKKQGNLVQAGEVIAIVGSTGKYSTGMHLHFELWNDGSPLNPEKFIDFE